jgi:hypothetical protein
MKIPDTLADCLSQGLSRVSRRRSFLSLASLAGMIALAPESAAAHDRDEHDHVHDDEDDEGKLRRNDFNILIAAEIAEALAVTTYSNIIDTAPFFTRLATDDQGYLRAAREEEMSHYLLEKSVTQQPSPFTTFFYPPKMFLDEFAASVTRTSASQPRESWVLRAIIALWQGSWVRELTPATEVRLNPLQVFKA